MALKFNPWAVQSLNDFNFYCCPECDLKSHNKQDFVNHAFKSHPEGAPALYQIKDQTILGLNFPIKQDSVQVKSEIKNEIEINFTENIHEIDNEVYSLLKTP